MDLRTRALALAEANARQEAAAKAERAAETLRLSSATFRDFCRQFDLDPGAAWVQHHEGVLLRGESHGYVTLLVRCPKDRHEIELGRVRGQYIPNRDTTWDDDDDQSVAGAYRWDEDEVLLTLASFWSGQACTHCRECSAAERAPQQPAPAPEPSLAEQLAELLRRMVREEATR